MNSKKTLFSFLNLIEEEEQAISVLFENEVVREWKVQFNSFTDTGFKKCKFEQVTFEYVNFTSTDFYNCKFINCEFVNCSFIKCKFVMGEHINSTYLETKFNLTIFDKLFGKNLYFPQVEISATKFLECELVSTEFTNSKFLDCQFITTKIEDSKFIKTLLQDTDLSSSVLNMVYIDVDYLKNCILSPLHAADILSFYGVNYK